MLSAAELCLIGASDMPALLGVSPWSGPVALWARIVHGIKGETTQSQEEGTAAEEYNRALYRRATGYHLCGPAKWRHPLHPWMRCSPDDTAEDTPDGRRGVELKRYQRLDGWGAAGTDEVPEDVWVQVQVQAGVGLDLGQWDAAAVDVSALLRGEHRLYSVPHVPEVYARCVEVAERFWADFVVPKRCPEGERLVLLERDAMALRALYPAPVREEPMAWDSLPPAAQRLMAAWLEANKARKGWAKQEEALARQVEHLLREAPGVALPEGMSARRVDYKAQRGTPQVDMVAFRAALKDEAPEVVRRVEELLRQCTRETTTRPLRVY